MDLRRRISKFKNHLNVRQDNYDFQSILGNISDEIPKNELEKMLFLLSEVIPGGKRESIKHAYEVFGYLKTRGLIGENNVTYLVNLLKDIKREDLAKRLKNHNAHTVKPHKCIVVGESSCGKTALALRIMYDSFSDDYRVTICPDCLRRNIYLKEKSVAVEMWDTVGMESLNNFLPDQFFRDVSVVLIVFAINNHNSFTETDKWKKEVQLKCDDDTTLLLVGNKLDLHEQRVVDSDMGKEKAAEFGAQYMEVSAKNGANAEAILTEIANVLPPTEELYFSHTFDKTTSTDVSTQTPIHMSWRERHCNC